MTSTTASEYEGDSSNRHRTHVCSDCGRLHEVVPTCVVCDEAIQLRRHWYEMGYSQGLRETEFEMSAEIATLRSRISELEGRASKAASQTALRFGGAR